MGIVNVTPDSFSDGGRFLAHDAAIAHGLAMAAAGADLVDVGGESTRPGAAEVPVAEEVGRVVPVVAALASEGVAVSIDTSKAAVAEAALDAGAVVVNDVTALGDPAMAPLAADRGAGVVLMHMLGTPRTMQREPRYDDVVAEVREYLLARAAVAEAAGIDPSAVCLDPGIGFGKTLEHNLALLAGIGGLASAGYPVLVGASRKSWITLLLGEDLDPADRDPVTVAAHTLAIAGGAAAIRVHDVVMGLRSARTADAIVRASTKGRSG
ncbi:MAG: dihydropteroate synthase [Actinobacteria bacterium]|nr:dihydropteroate synthase [Actinomycetota bacterium]